VIRGVLLLQIYYQIDDESRTVRLISAQTVDLTTL
jgi:hypothetical protein